MAGPCGEDQTSGSPTRRRAGRPAPSAAIPRASRPAWSPGGARLARLALTDGRAWDVATGRETPSAAAGGLTAGLSPDGMALATAGRTMIPSTMPPPATWRRRPPGLPPAARPAAAEPGDRASLSCGPRSREPGDWDAGLLPASPGRCQTLGGAGGGSRRCVYRRTGGTRSGALIADHRPRWARTRPDLAASSSAA
jgi:hypothetical protein